MKTILIIILCSFFAMPCFALSAEDLGNLGSFIGGITALFGIPFLLLNIYYQKKSLDELKIEQLHQKREQEFRLRCESIDSSFQYVSNGNVTGATAIIGYGDLCGKESMNIDNVINNVGASSLKAVLAGIAELIRWTTQDKEHFEYYNIYRARYVAIVIAFEKMLPAEANNKSNTELLKMCNNNQDKYSLLVSIKEIQLQDFNLWVDVEEFKKDPS